MRRKVLSVALAILAVTGMLGACTIVNSESDSTSSSGVNSSDSSSSSTSTSSSSSFSDPSGDGEESVSLASEVEDGVILHAWNWSMDAIKELLPDIAAAGYSTVQTSPMQPQKDYYANGTWCDQWWKLYQPLGMTVATKNNAIGTKDNLIELCEAADQYGIKIIVDVVSNHLAGGGSESLNPDVEEYEPEIYNRNLIHTGVGGVDDNNVKQLVQGYLGDYPDLQTENEVVQQAVLDLLCEYVDCGVDGFRFDAAKHIETKYDGVYASGYWDYILDGVQDYAEEKGEDPLYFYGEILNTVGSGRDISWYTELMDVTDTPASWNILNAVTGHSASNVARDDLGGYSVGDHQSVLWGESHDTYANDYGGTMEVSQENIDKAYAIAASRGDATSLYFARPDSNTILGDVGTYAWEGEAVSQVNWFHNRFIGCEDNLSSSDDVFVNVRSSSTQTGAVLVDCDEGGGRDISIQASSLPDGEYVDLVSGNTFIASSGTLSGIMDDSGIAVLSDSGASSTLPTISVSHPSGYYDVAIDVTVNVSDADTSYYIFDDGEREYFDGETTVTIGDGFTGGDVHTLDVVAENSDGTRESTYTYTFLDEISSTIAVENNPYDFVNGRNVGAWVWRQGESGRWVDGTLDGTTFTFEVEPDDDYFLLACCDDDKTLSWDTAVGQTENVTIVSGQTIYDGSQIGWKWR